jgi:hypothetical protein
MLEKKQKINALQNKDGDSELDMVPSKEKSSVIKSG